MSAIIETLAEEPRKVLVALSLFRFLTVDQLLRLGVSEKMSAPVIRNHAIARLEKRARPLAKSKTLSRWKPKVHYLTKHGAEELESMFKYPPGTIPYPKGQVQFGERLAEHRFAQIDFHIGLRLWAETRGARVHLGVMDFDVDGSRKGRNFEALTTINVPNSKTPVVADGLFAVTLNDTSILYALEVHRTTETTRVAYQIRKYMDVLESGALSFKYACNWPAMVCSVHTKPNVLRGVKKHLMNLPDFPAFKHLFLFNTTEQLAVDFSQGWTFADDTAANPFPVGATPPEQGVLLDEPVVISGELI